VSALVTRIGPTPFYGRLAAHIRNLRDQLLFDSAKIVRQEEETSIRRLWHDQGRTLRSLQQRFILEGDSFRYELEPTAPHAMFGEYGTGRRGAATGQPAPKGWRYGPRKGIAARRYSRIAVAAAKPQIDALAKQRVRVFAANLTVN
jgi:hypothetical protein